MKDQDVARCAVVDEQVRAMLEPYPLVEAVRTVVLSSDHYLDLLHPSLCEPNHDPLRELPSHAPGA